MPGMRRKVTFIKLKSFYSERRQRRISICICLINIVISVMIKVRSELAQPQVLLEWNYTL